MLQFIANMASRMGEVAMNEMAINNLMEISDGRLFGLNEMVKVDCHDCQGCSDCCKDMGQSIILDPYDAKQLADNLGKSFEELLNGPIELHSEEGLILPNLKMEGQDISVCHFLDENGRCSIHTFRPGLCRLFPLGRNYEQEKMEYFLLKNECKAENRSKMKVSKWLGVNRIKEYHQFLIDWHSLTKEVRNAVEANIENEAIIQQLTMMFLQMFFIKPYVGADFFQEFNARKERFMMVLK